MPPAYHLAAADLLDPPAPPVRANLVPGSDCRVISAEVPATPQQPVALRSDDTEASSMRLAASVDPTNGTSIRAVFVRIAYSLYFG